MVTTQSTRSVEAAQPGIKHWRTFGAAEWGHVKEGAFGLLLGSILPVAVFYVALRAWGFSIAVVLILSWSAAVFVWHFRRAHGVDVFSGTTFVFACIKAMAGLVSQDVELYLKWPSLENMVYATLFFGSALI